MLSATTLGVTQFCIDNIGLHYFYVNLGFFHPMLMPTLGLTLISKVFFAKLGSFTQYCTHQHWVVQKQHVFSSLLGFLPNVDVVSINIGLCQNSMFLGHCWVVLPNVVPINIAL